MKKQYIIIMEIIFFFVVGCLSFYLMYDKHIYIHTMSSLAVMPSCDKKRLVVQKGDVVSYLYVRDSIKQDKRIPYPNYLYYSIVMANTFDYVPANYDVYTAICDLFSYKYDSGYIDSRSKAMAKFYLLRGAYKGDIVAINELRRLKLKMPKIEPKFSLVDRFP